MNGLPPWARAPPVFGNEHITSHTDVWPYPLNIPHSGTHCRVIHRAAAEVLSLACQRFTENLDEVGVCPTFTCVCEFQVLLVVQQSGTHCTRFLVVYDHYDAGRSRPVLDEHG